MPTGSDVLLEILRENGVRHIFGNPGSTEAPFMHALIVSADAPQYVLGLQEAAVVGMADGYASVTRRPAFVNLHTVAGVGNGMGNLANARTNMAPLVVTAGQPDLRQDLADPFLGGDTHAIAEPVAKWSRRVNSPLEIAPLLRRAFHDAASPPRGPVFVGLPTNVLDEQIDGPEPPSVERTQQTVPADVSALVRLLTEPSPGRLAIVASDEVVDSGADQALIKLAEWLGAHVFGAPLHGRGVFPPAHPLWRGTMPSTVDGIRRALGGFQRTLLLGGRVFMLYPYSPGRLEIEGVELIQIAPDPAQLGRTWGVRYAAQGDLAGTLGRVIDALSSLPRSAAVGEVIETRRKEREAEIAQREATATKRYATTPLHPMAAVHAILRASPPDVFLVDEAVSAGVYARGFHRPSRPGRYFFSRGGGLGWGMPAAVGISLGTGGERVLCLVGDGSACYSPQAMWTAARLRLPVVFAVIDNSGYEVLLSGLRERLGGNTETPLVGMDLTQPSPDPVALAAAFGVAGVRAARADEIGDAVRSAIDADGPRLVYVPIAAL